MTLTAHGAVTGVTDQVSTMLLLGLFISRGLVCTLLLKPTEYGLMDDEPSNLGISNLKVRLYKVHCIHFSMYSMKSFEELPLLSSTLHLHWACYIFCMSIMRIM